MDYVFAEAVTKIMQLPQRTQREIGSVLLNKEVPPPLPVIEFESNEPRLDPLT